MRDGEAPVALAGLYADVVNAIIAGRDPGLAVTMHTYRGNAMSMWMAEGGYDSVVEIIFDKIDVDGFFSNMIPSASAASNRCGSFPRTRRLCSGW